MAALAERSPLLPGTLAVRCEDTHLCVECSTFWSFASVRCEGTDWCRETNDLKLIDGAFVCMVHRAVGAASQASGARSA